MEENGNKPAGNARLQSGRIENKRSASEGLNLSPPITINLDYLDADDAKALRTQLRMLSARMEHECIVSNSTDADLTFSSGKKNWQDALLIVARNGRREFLQRPVKLVPLGDALARLANGMRVTAMRGKATALQRLSQVIYERNAEMPVRLSSAVWGDLLIDGKFQWAWSNLPAIELLQKLARHDRFDACTPIADEDLPAILADSRPWHPVRIEEICWALMRSIAAAPVLERWRASPDTLIRLNRWPNLDALTGYGAWSEFFAGFDKPMTMQQAVARTALSGIEPADAWRGLSLLLLFRHALIVEQEHSSHELTAATEWPAVIPGLLQRLKLLWVKSEG